MYTHVFNMNHNISVKSEKYLNVFFIILYIYIYQLNTSFGFLNSESIRCSRSSRTAVRYQLLQQREHVLKRPDMYIGPTEPRNETVPLETERETPSSWAVDAIWDAKNWAWRGLVDLVVRFLIYGWDFHVNWLFWFGRWFLFSESWICEQVTLIAQVTIWWRWYSLNGLSRTKTTVCTNHSPVFFPQIKRTPA